MLQFVSKSLTNLVNGIIIIILSSPKEQGGRVHGVRLTPALVCVFVFKI